MIATANCFLSAINYLLTTMVSLPRSPSQTLSRVISRSDISSRLLVLLALGLG